MNRTFVSVAVATCIVAAAGSGSAAPPQEQAFLKEAIQTNLAEIAVGKLAESKGGTSAARQFGRTLVADHSANDAMAKKVAATMGVTPPTQPDPAAQQDYQRLSRESGAAFDRDFAAMMLQGHRKAISDFEKAAALGRRNPVGAYANETLPALRKHLRLAQSLASAGR